MEIQQKDSETLTTYIHRFKKEAKHCNFDSHPAKIRIFLKGLINSSRITLSVYEQGPTTIEDAIGIVEKISSAQHIAASFSQNHQISMMKRGPNDHHMPNQDCSNCGQLGHPWFTCPRIICDRCNQCGHIYRHCWDRLPLSGTASPPKNHHNHGRRPSCPRYPVNRCDDRRSCSRSSVKTTPERLKHKLLKTPQHRQAHQQGQKPRTKAHTGPQLNSKPITPQTAVK